MTVQRADDDRLTEETLRLALEGTQTGSWIWDVETDVISWSANLGALHRHGRGLREGATSAGPLCACSDHCSTGASGAPVTTAFGLSAGMARRRRRGSLRVRLAVSDRGRSGGATARIAWRR